MMDNGEVLENRCEALFWGPYEKNKPLRYSEGAATEVQILEKQGAHLAASPRCVTASASRHFWKEGGWEKYVTCARKLSGTET